MSSVTNLGRRARQFRAAPEFGGYSRVIVQVSDEVEYTAGNATGNTLTLVCPWGTQKIANDILTGIRGFSYQPYEARGALLDPAAELGDGVSVKNIYSGIFDRKTVFSSSAAADITAPHEEEIDHEYPYAPKQNREVRRKLLGLTTELRVQDGKITAEVQARIDSSNALQAALNVQADRITAEVSQRKNDVNTLNSTLSVQANRITAEVQERINSDSALQAAMNVQAGQISAKVSKSGGSASSFGWELTDSQWTVSAGGSTILKATKNGLEVNGKVVATSGKIGGFDIQSSYLSYNAMTWGGTNTTGIYLGTSGIQLGKNFKVSADGHLTAASGTFLGTVRANQVEFGGDAGYMDGEALSGHSVGWAELGYGAVNTSITSGGINTSLGYADYANTIFNGANTAPTMKANYMAINTLDVKTALYIPYGSGLKKVTPTYMGYKDASGNSKYGTFLMIS